MAKRKTDEQWVKIFNSTYNSNEYKLIKLHREGLTTFEIMHISCGNIFFVNITHLSRKDGCPACKPNRVKSDEEYTVLFNSQSNINGYTLLSIDRSQKYIKYKIKHNCGETFYISISDFLNRGDRCPKCSINSKKNIDEYKIIFLREFGVNSYELLSKKEYKNDNNKSRIDFTILCKKCNKIFVVTDSFKKLACPKCIASAGEQKIANVLDKHNISYLQEHWFIDCRNKNPLPFDFYIPKFNLIIEFDGIQHYEPVEFFGGIEGLKERQYWDNYKNTYCREHNIRILRIAYTEFDGIEDIICEEIKRWS